MPDALLKFMQLSKVDTRQNLLFGVFSAEVLDKSGEVADYEMTKAAFQKFSAEFEKVSGGKSLGPVRKMHTDEIAGGIKTIEYDDVNRLIKGCVEVTPEIAAQAAKGWLNGFSIGGGYAKKWPDPVHKGAKRFAPIIAEVSVVDNPCVPDATFENFAKDASFAVLKEDGSEELRKFVARPAPEVLTKYVAKDGSIHDTLDAALAKNKEIAAAATPDPVEEALKKVEALADPEKKEDPAPVLKKLSEIFDLKKGLCDVARIAGIVDELGWVAEGLAAEAFYEGDGSKNPDKLKDVIKRLSAFLMSLVKEELADATKAAPEFTGRDVEVLRKIAGAELFKDWTAPVIEDTAKKEIEDKLAKAVSEVDAVKAERDALQKKLDEVPLRIEAALEKVNKRLHNIENQPAGSGAPMFVIEKDKSVGEISPAASRLSPGDFANKL